MKVTSYRLPDSDTIRCTFVGSVTSAGAITVENVISGELVSGLFLGPPSDGHRLSQLADGTWVAQGQFTPAIAAGTTLQAWNREVYVCAGEADHRIPANALDVSTVESAVPNAVAATPLWGFDLGGA